MTSKRSSPSPRRLAPALSLIWVIGFCLLFYSFDLPNNPQVNRLDIWAQLPDLLMANLPGDDSEPSGGWRNLLERLPVLLIAGAILAGAWAVGQLVLRILNPPLGESAWERSVFAFGLGLAGWSLITLGCGLAGLLDRSVFAGLIFVCVTAELLQRWRNWHRTQSIFFDWNSVISSGWISWRVCGRGLLLAVALLFLWTMLLGALLPPTDFDVKAYHLLGPKEYYLAGEIRFLPHNVYTSFPFLTEMLSLSAMVLADDWYLGALAGKAVLWAFAPLSAAAIYAAGRRWFTPQIGAIAAVIFLSTPWIYRISIIAYAEGGLTYYLFISLMAMMTTIDCMREGNLSLRLLILTGLCAGSAMACKYPGVVSVVIPIGVCLVWGCWKGEAGHRRVSAAFRTALFYSAGVFIAVGPWLVKNTIETGNPVYPLMYTVFGGRDWDAELDHKWRAAHARQSIGVSHLGENIVDVTLKSDWLSPLLFALAPCALIPSAMQESRQRRMIFGLWLFTIYLFACWWLLTHRIDRFWVPMIPVVALLSGIGFSLWKSVTMRLAGAAILSLTILYSLAFMTTGLCGNNQYLSDYEVARRVAESPNPPVPILNQELPDGSRVLAVGDAQLFDARFDVVYNSVFDYSLIEKWLSGQSFEQAREILSRHGITHIYVNWAEILRYRETYGYTEYVDRARLTGLVEAEVLGPPVVLTWRDASLLNEKSWALISQWSPTLIKRERNRELMISAELYKVLDQ